MDDGNEYKHVYEKEYEKKESKERVWWVRII
jgi:hypothetical protein